MCYIIRKFDTVLYNKLVSAGGDIMHINPEDGDNILTKCAKDNVNLIHFLVNTHQLPKECINHANKDHLTSLHLLLRLNPYHDSSLLLAAQCLLTAGADVNLPVNNQLLVWLYKHSYYSHLLLTKVLSSQQQHLTRANTEALVKMCNRATLLTQGLCEHNFQWFSKVLQTPFCEQYKLRQPATWFRYLNEDNRKIVRDYACARSEYKLKLNYISLSITLSEGYC